MGKEKKEEKVIDPVVITIKDPDGNERAWKRSECNEHQLELIRELEPIGHDLIAITKKFNEVNRNKEYRIRDFVAAGNDEEMVVDNPEQNPIPEEK
mgnify:FL=1|jgi:hypothetical protein|tara:strand:- start:8067 stop:8354 length:288 start_codon:yes stop_codon:yes gene_type:complete